MKIIILIFSIGAFSALSMAPANFWPALFIGLSALYYCLTKSKTNIKAALTGFFFSLGYFGFSLSWIGNALLIEDNPYWWVWPIAVSGLPALLSLFTAIGCYIYKRICKDKNNINTYIAFAAIILLSEYARGHMLTGFPWNLYGYTWIDILPIAQVASLSNIYLLTLLTILWASAPAFLLTSNHTKKSKVVITTLIIFSFCLSYLYGSIRINQNPTKYYDQYEVILIQPNIKQSEKWKPEKRADNFLQQIKQSKYNPKKNSPNKTAYYIIWPETAISQDILDTPWTLNQITKMLQSYPANAYLITGALRYEKDNKTFYNSVVTLNKNAEIIHTYNKSHLVPFGEYIPFNNLFNIAPIVGFTGFKKGNGQTLLEMPEGIKFSPLICYEIIFPQKSIDYTNSPPDIIINLTNDAWYGNSAGPYQHLVQSRFRAIETGIPILRSANTGISALINPLGYNTKDSELSKKISIIEKIPIYIAKAKQSNYIEKLLIIFLITYIILLNYSKWHGKRCKSSNVG